MATEPHPFAEVLRTIGRGPTLSRPLDEAEAEAALGMVLDGAVDPLQLGAFLLVLRYRTETAAELAGFVRAARQRLVAGPAIDVDLDWPSYADRHKQLPYFVLSALLLADAGISVLMHGIEGEGKATTPKVLEALGLPLCRDVAEASDELRRRNFAYLPLRVLCPPLAALFDLRPLLGLRSPVNTLARELNPFRAPHQIQGIFHPTYLELHQETAERLGQPATVIFKGGGGEGQRNPDKPCRALGIRDGAPIEELWPTLTTGPTHPWRNEDLDPASLVALWNGDRTPEGPIAAVTGTVAMALVLLGRAASKEEAQAAAESLWNDRERLAPGSR